MEKYKICPNCKKHNGTNEMVCECGYDIDEVPITDDAKENERTKKEEKEPEHKLFRYCDNCDTKNEANARKCINCQEDISGIELEEERSDSKKAPYMIESIDGKVFMEIDKDTLIGRESILAEYLSEKTYVSRNHAKLTISGGELFIQNISKTNFTYVNNIKIDENVPVKLSDGDEIGLGGIQKDGKRQDLAAYFVVRKN